MSDNTRIEWADATWNPITGCGVVSAGCTNCYAMRLAGGRMRHHPTRAGLTTQTKAGPVWNGEVRFNEDVLSQPLRWRRSRRIFVCAHGDLFHEAVPNNWIGRVFGVMAAAPHHVFLVLTKRPQRMRMFCGANGVINNVWMGVSVEDQRTADERIPTLLATPGARRWISAEPLLGPVDLGDIAVQDGAVLDWVVVGGESGPGARGCDVQWIRDIVRSCGAASVPCFVKQLGSHAVNGNFIWPSTTKKGADPAEWPEDLRVRQWPGAVT